MKNITFQQLHDGEEPTRIMQMRSLVGQASPVGELCACSYVSSRDNRAAVRRHVFSRHRGRLPYLLRSDPSGAHTLEPPPPKMVALGRALDLELMDGQRVITGLSWLTTSEAGHHVWLLSEHPIYYAIERRAGGPYVTARGIER